MNDSTIRVGPVLASMVQAIDAFDHLEQIMGPYLARKTWKLIQARKHGPKGPRNPKADALLLKIYDHLKCATPDHMKGAKGMIARNAARYPIKFGNSPQAIEKHLSRLIAERDKKLDEQIRALAASIQTWNQSPDERTSS